MDKLRWLVTQILEESDEEDGERRVEEDCNDCRGDVRSAGDNVTVTFQPGKMGLRVDWNSGHVVFVYGFQAERAGVRAGWNFECIDGEPFNARLLRQKLGGDMPYEVTFATCNMVEMLGSSGTQHSPQFRRLRRALEEPLVDKRRLADLVWLGAGAGKTFADGGTIGECCLSRVRCEAWQMLLGYRPLLQERRCATLRRKRREYSELRHTICQDASELGGGEISEEQAATLSQINLDLSRLALCGAAAGHRLAVPLQDLVHTPGLQAVMARVLFVWSVRQPAAGYVQGLHDVLLPLLLLFLADSANVDASNWEFSSAELDLCALGALDDVEADCYWCFTKLVGEVIDHYTEGQPGLQRATLLLKSLLADADDELFQHLELEGLDLTAVALRWLGCLMVRELPINLCLRLWDACIAESALGHASGFSDFLVYFCASFLIHHGARLRDAPLDELMAFVQEPPTLDLGECALEALISRAYVLRSTSNDLSKLRASDGLILHQSSLCLENVETVCSSLTTSASPSLTPVSSSRASETDDGAMGRMSMS